ncbi:hypothetical protein HDV01_005769 [Terramyces sp. JEL0728]|nr:hypothetical protein HDV01_005769 [Terramyces sp. JEL0728]
MSPNVFELMASKMQNSRNENPFAQGKQRKRISLLSEKSSKSSFEDIGMVRQASINSLTNLFSRHSFSSKKSQHDSGFFNEGLSIKMDDNLHTQGQLVFAQFFEGQNYVSLDYFIKILGNHYTPNRKLDIDGISHFLHAKNDAITPEDLDNSIFLDFQSGSLPISEECNQSLGHLFADWKLDTSDDYVRVAMYYYDGETITQNHFNAVRMLQKCIKKFGDVPEANFALGVCYLNGCGIEQNDFLAFKSFKFAAKQGHARSSLYLSRCYRWGLGTDIKLDKAYMYLKKSADMEELDAEYEYAQSCSLGVWIEATVYDGFLYFEKAAKKEHLESQFELGNCYKSGNGCVQNYSQALKWYEIAADRGYASAQNALAKLYETGKGDAVRMELAFYWYQQASLQGYDPAINNLGLMYLEGKGMEPNATAAVECFRRSSNYGQSQYHLGHCYMVGVGVDKIPQLAAHWFTLAAQNEVKEAQNNLGFCYEIGFGVVKNLEEAARYYTLASQQGDENGLHNLEDLYNDNPQLSKNTMQSLLMIPINPESSILKEMGLE